METKTSNTQTAAIRDNFEGKFSALDTFKKETKSHFVENDNERFKMRKNITEVEIYVDENLAKFVNFEKMTSNKHEEAMKKIGTNLSEIEGIKGMVGQNHLLVLEHHK